MSVQTHIDGSQLEGGGQILRNATAIAAIVQRPISVSRIRAGRSKPGLSPQHLTGLQLVTAITGGTLEGGAIRSTDISFKPGPPPLRPGTWEADTKTAGSCTLMVQQALPVLLFASPAPGGPASSRVTLRGGTDAAFAPPIGYLQHVCVPTLQRLVSPLCAGLSLDVVRRGFFPKGGGEVELTVPPLPPGTSLPAWQLTERGTLIKIRGWAVIAGKVKPEVAQHMAAAVRQQLADALRDPAVVFGPAGSGGGGDGSPSPSPLKRHKASGDSEHQQQDSMPDVVLDVQAIHEPPERAVGDGGSLVLVAETSAGCLFGASALAERGVAAEAVAAMAVRDLLEELRSGAAVDQWLQDQLIIFMALAVGTSGRSSMVTSEPTMHTRTAIAIAEQLLPAARFTVEALPAASSQGGDARPQLYRVSCVGAGVVAPSSVTLRPASVLPTRPHAL